MHMSKFFRVISIVMIVSMFLLFAVGCGEKEQINNNNTEASSSQSDDNSQAKAQEPAKKKLTIGLSMATLQEERWQRDRDIFTSKAEELGAEVVVQSANGDENLQNSQGENLITQGVDVLVVIPQNGDSAAAIVESAHEAGIKVLAYDRLINNCDLDCYITFDNVKVGELQAGYVVEKYPKGNYILIGGSPTDNNAKLVRQGQMNVLQPYIDKGDIKVVADQWAKGWNPEEALKYVENALTAVNNDVAAVITSNDGCAGGAIQALAEQKLAGKVGVPGQDADLAACQRIVEGTQSMTVYKPVKAIASKAAELAVALAKGETIQSDSTTNNGKIDVPSVLLTPVQVDASNMYEVVIKDGWHKIEDVYKNVPKDEWPKD